MKKVLSIIFLVLPFFVSAQTQPPIVQGSKLYRFVNGIKPDSALFLPRRDTTNADPAMLAPGMIQWRPSDQRFYGRDSTAWRGFASSADIVKYRIDSTVSTVADLATLSGVEGDAVMVKDPIRGGVFYWLSSGTADNGITFAGSAGYWVRQYNPADGILVDWFGADPTGAANSAPVIQNVFGFAQKVVFRPGGVYLISDSVYVNNKVGVTVDFNGATIIEDNSFINTIAFKRCDDLVVKNGSFDGVEDYAYFQAHNPTTNRQYILLDSCNNAIVTNIKAKNKRAVLRLSLCSNFDVNDIWYEGIFKAPGTNQGFCQAIFVAGYGYAPLTGTYTGWNKISRVHAVDAGQVVILGDNATYVSITNCSGERLYDNAVYVSSALYCIVADNIFRKVAGAGVKARGVGHVITNNVITNSGLGVAVTGVNNLGEDSIFYKTPDKYGGNGHSTIVSGNVIDSVTVSGIDISDVSLVLAHTYIITNNVVRYNSHATGYLLKAQLIGGSHISGNTFTGSNAPIGIYFQNSSTDSSQINIFSNNIFRDFSAECIRLQGIKNSIISNNNFDSIGTNAMVFVNCSNNTISDNRYKAGAILNLTLANNNHDNIISGNIGTTITVDNTDNILLYNSPNVQASVGVVPKILGQISTSGGVPRVSTGISDISDWEDIITVSDGNYIENQAVIDQTGANFRIDGAGTASYFAAKNGTSVSGLGAFSIRNSTNHNRWVIGLFRDEVGGNEGADFALWRYDDADSIISPLFTADRKTGITTFDTSMLILGRLDINNRAYVDTTGHGSFYTLDLQNLPSGDVADSVLTINPTTKQVRAINISSMASGVVPSTRNINTTPPLAGGGDLSADRTLSISQSNTSTDGYLSNTDWNTFNNKLTSVNGLAGPALTLATGTAGTNFTITPSGSTIIFDLPDASTTARGVVTTTAQTWAGVKTIPGIINSLVAGNAYAPTTSSLSAVTNATYLPTGVSTIYLRAGVGGTTATTIAANSSFASYVHGKVPVTLSGTGTHAIGANLMVLVPTISGGAAPVTDFASAWIDGAPTGGLNNYALYVRSGNSFFGGRVAGSDAVNTNEFITLGQGGGLYAPVSGSANYIQNQSAIAQPSSNFNISGNGAIGGEVQTSLINSNNSAGAVQIYGGSTPGKHGGQIVLYGGSHSLSPGFINFFTGTGAGIQPVRMTINGTGNVGIGTTTPQGLLHINTANTLGLYIQNTGALSTSSGAFLRMYNSGTPSATDQRLGGVLWGANTTGTTYQAGAQIDGWSEGAWTNGVSHPTYIGFRTTASGSTAVAERMRITAAGRVGINQAVPNSTLDVNGTITAPTLISPSGSSLVLQATTGDQVLLVTNGTTRQTINDDGSIDMGTVTAPFGTIKLNVGGNIQSNDAFVLTDGTTNAEFGLGGASAFIRTVSNHPLYLMTNDVENMRITAAGDVGIGTSAPDTKLHVAGAGTFDGFLDIGGGAASITGLGSASFTSLNVAGVTVVSGGLNSNAVTTPSLITSGEFRAPIRNTAVSTTLTATDHTLRATASGITLTLPAASTCNGRIYVLMNYNTGGTVTTSAFFNLSAVSTTTIANQSSVMIQSDGTNWYLIK